MWFSSSLAGALTALFALTNAVPTPSTHVLHEKRTSIPRFWTRGERVERDALLPIRIGLTQSNLENSYEHLMDVSHPSSPNYGKHWTPSQVHDMYAPSPTTIHAVREWLLLSGVDDSVIIHSDNKGWIAMELPAWKAEELFQTVYHEHVHASGAVRVGSEDYYLPEHIRGHIDYITPGIKLSASLTKKSIKPKRHFGHHTPGPKKSAPSQYHHPKPPTASSLPAALQNCGVNITIACVKALYNVPDTKYKDSINALGLYESGDVYAQEDLNLYFAAFAPNVPQGTHPKLESIDGGQAPVAPGSNTNTGESDIDMDIAFSLIHPQTITLYQVDGPIEAAIDGGFNTFLDALDGSYCTYTAYNISGNTPGIDPVYPDPAKGGYKGPLMCGTYKPTRVISVSYGASEHDAPVNYTKRQCNEFLKLGLQGHSFLWASGDYGVASFPGDDSDSGCLGDKEKIYNPSFSTCPYVTNVGATRLYDDQTVLDPESAMQANLGVGAELFSSSGGFANYFPAPAYQASALSTYFKNHDPGLPYYTANAGATNVGANGGVYNRAGRGLPDVSASGARFLAFNNESLYHFYGTSLSAPIWGSIVTLINQERTQIGKGPVGFINPVLYENTWVFNDIANGSNPGCSGPGFAAVKGWDPVTGLGTPKYPSLLKLFLSLP